MNEAVWDNDWQPMADNRTICTEKCWTAVACPDHGGRMYPFGRSAGLEAYYCCDNYADPKLNPRHLWSEHDSTRWYTDPDGWNAHEASCPECKGDDDEWGAREVGC